MGKNKKQPTPAQLEKKRKSNNAEANRRTFAVYSFLVRGADRVRIWQYAASKWSLSQRQTDRYIAEATRWLELATEDKRDVELKKSKAQRMDLYYKAYAQEDLALCHEIRKDFDKLVNLYPAEKGKLQIGGTLNVNQPVDANKVLDSEVDGTGKTVLEIVRDAYRKPGKEKK